MSTGNSRFKIAIVAFLFVASSMPAPANAAVLSRSVIPSRMFQLSPPVGDEIIQAFDNGSGTDFFISQQVGSGTRISRCSREPTGNCTQKDSVVLPNYGHGESLEVYVENGRTYAWVGSKGSASTTSRFATEVSLIEYIKAPAGSKQAKYRRIGSLTGLAAVAPGKSGPGVRSAVALADKSDRLALRVQISSGGSNSYYGIYKTAALTSLMKKATGQNLSISKASSLRVSQFKEPSRPYNSFQGFDIKGVGANKKFLYLFGGPAGKPGKIYRFSYTNGGNVKHDRTYTISGTGMSALEAEGIKMEADPTSGGKERGMLHLDPTRVDSSRRKISIMYRFVE